MLDQTTVLDPLRTEYAALLDRLIETWVMQGQMRAPTASDSFYDKLKLAYQAECDWFQPMDISLPGSQIQPDTPMHFSKNTFKLLTCPTVLDIVEQLIGPEITSNPIQHVRLKPPVPDLHATEVRPHIARTDWHQDRGVALSDADDTAMVTVWMAVSDATKANDCLQVIPRTTETGLLPYCGKSQITIADNFLDETQAIPLPVRSGGVVLFHPLTPHASLDNMTGTFRWSFDIRYNRTGQSTGRSHFPEFIARSQTAPEIVLSDWQEWKQMWKTARAQLSGQSHIPISRWTSTSPFCA